MAYSSTVTIRRIGPRDVLVEISEEEIGTDDTAEIQIPGLVPYGPVELVRVIASLQQAGDAATVQPTIYSSAQGVASTDVDVQWETDSADAADPVDLQPSAAMRCDAEGSLYWRLRPDVATGGSGVSESRLYLRLGWSDAR